LKSLEFCAIVVGYKADTRAACLLFPWDMSVQVDADISKLQWNENFDEDDIGSSAWPSSSLGDFTPFWPLPFIKDRVYNSGEKALAKIGNRLWHVEVSKTFMKKSSRWYKVSRFENPDDELEVEVKASDMRPSIQEAILHYKFSYER
jgi:hypothetical protein